MVEECRQQNLTELGILGLGDACDSMETQHEAGVRKFIIPFWENLLK
jgi:hypothetical protein